MSSMQWLGLGFAFGWLAGIKFCVALDLLSKRSRPKGYPK
jgi:hypothetical protein